MNNKKFGVYVLLHEIGGGITQSLVQKFDNPSSAIEARDSFRKANPHLQFIVKQIF